MLLSICLAWMLEVTSCTLPKETTVWWATVWCRAHLFIYESRQLIHRISDSYRAMRFIQWWRNCSHIILINSYMPFGAYIHSYNGWLTLSLDSSLLNKLYTALLEISNKVYLAKYSHVYHIDKIYFLFLFCSSSFYFFYIVQIR